MVHGKMLSANPKVRILLLALLIIAALLLGCEDNWDGMDRSGWDWSGGQARTEGMR